MKLTPLESFDCYTSPRNDGKEFIENEGLNQNCHGVELKVCGKGPIRTIALTPLPMDETHGDEVDFITRCREKLDNPDLIELFKGDWVHFATMTDMVPLLSGRGEVRSLVMCFRECPEFTWKDARRYKKLMGVQ